MIVGAFSFLIAKNLISYFAKNYPYRRWVKGFTLVNMIYQLFIKPKKPGEEVIESKILSVLERKGIDKLLS